MSAMWTGEENGMWFEGLLIILIVISVCWWLKIFSFSKVYVLWAVATYVPGESTEEQYETEIIHCT